MSGLSGRGVHLRRRGLGDRFLSGPAVGGASSRLPTRPGACGPWTPLPDAPANPTGTATYQSTGLKCGTTYAYHVWAFNAAGASAQTNEAAASTSSCP